MKSVSGFYGIYPVAFALFGADGALNRAAVRTQVQAMVRHGVHGIAVLGLASEVHRLSASERQCLMEWVIEDAAGRVPVAVTIAEPSVEARVAFAAQAKAVGAAWLILQPPPDKAGPEAALIRFFGAVAEEGGRASALALDMTDAGQVAERLGALTREGGSFPAMVDAVGITGVTNMPGHLVSLEDFDRVLAINLRGALVLMQALLPAMLADGYGAHTACRLYRQKRR